MMETKPKDEKRIYFLFINCRQCGIYQLVAYGGKQISDTF